MISKSIDDIQIGAIATFSKTFTEEDVLAFAKISGDFNPIHTDDAYAQTTRFKKRIVHGILTASLISSVLAAQLPGLGTIYLSQNLTFVAPVFLNDTITAKVEVIDIINQKIVRLRTTCTNQDNVVVIEGEACVLPPRKK